MLVLQLCNKLGCSNAMNFLADHRAVKGVNIEDGVELSKVVLGKEGVGQASEAKQGDGLKASCKCRRLIPDSHDSPTFRSFVMKKSEPELCNSGNVGVPGYFQRQQKRLS